MWLHAQLCVVKKMFRIPTLGASHFATLIRPSPFWCVYIAICPASRLISMCGRLNAVCLTTKPVKKTLHRRRRPVAASPATYCINKSTKNVCTCYVLHIRRIRAYLVHVYIFVFTIIYRVYMRDVCIWVCIYIVCRLPRNARNVIRITNALPANLTHKRVWYMDSRAAGSHFPGARIPNITFYLDSVIVWLSCLYSFVLNYISHTQIFNAYNYSYTNMFPSLFGQLTLIRFRARFVICFADFII